MLWPAVGSPYGCLEFDYRQPGAYFITVCTRNRASILGDVTEGKLCLNAAGRLAQAVWEELPQHYPHVHLDAWTVMPNHVHGIAILKSDSVDYVGADSVDHVGADSVDHVGADSVDHVGADSVDHVGADSVDHVGAGFKPAPTQRHGLPEIVRAFKTFSARRINALQGTAGTALWQRNYYEHVIRDEGALDRIRQYIADNPARWHEDPENPDAVRGR